MVPREAYCCAVGRAARLCSAAPPYLTKVIMALGRNRRPHIYIHTGVLLLIPKCSKHGEWLGGCRSLDGCYGGCAVGMSWSALLQI